MAYLPLSTANLPDPVIDPAQGASPEDYFNTVLYTGNGSTQSITGVGHQPDFTWIKQRSGTRSHGLMDAVRGGNEVLFSNSTSAEVSTTNTITSFDSDGFTLGNQSTTNESGYSYVAWNWKANGSGVTNTDGSITSTVSANTTSGFSIVSYTGNQTAGSTVGHGLGVKPDLIILKARGAATSWPVYHSSLGATKYVRVNSDLAAVTTSQEWNDTEPTSSVFTVGNASSNSNQSSAYIGYCFHSVDGFSKFGSYVGNGSTDGPFVYTGFRPAWVLIMCSSASANHPLADNARDTYNPAGTSLFPETADSDNSKTGREIDFLSNGFKIRNGNGEKNTSGATYIYMAFAENPFKYSNAR